MIKTEKAWGRLRINNFDTLGHYVIIMKIPVSDRNIQNQSVKSSHWL